MGKKDIMTRRNFAKLGAAGAALAPALIIGHSAAGIVSARKTDITADPDNAQSSSTAAADDKLQSELLFDLVFDKGAANKIDSPGVSRFIVPVTGGTFEGPKLKGTVVNPSADWLVVRPDGSSVLDIRMMLEIDDA